MRSLRVRLILSHLLPIVVIVLLTGVALFYLLETQFLLPSLTGNLMADARYLSEISRSEYQLYSNPVITGNLLNRVRINPAVRVMFLSANGRLLYSSDTADMASLGLPQTFPGLEKALSGQEVVRTNYSPFRMRDALIDVFAPVISPDGQVLGVVRVSYRSEMLYQLFGGLRNLIAGVLIAGLLLGTLLGLILALNIGNPIQRVTRAIYGLAHGDRATALPERGPQEIRELSRSVNYLVERLDTLETSRRHLLANLVHELGRPLGGMRSAIHALGKGAGQDPQLLQDLAAGMDAEADRMQRVLEELAHLHDQVVGPLELQVEPIALGEWLPTVLLPWRQAAEEKRLRWEENLATELPLLQADPLRLGQVIGNLAANAVKYTPLGGLVTVSSGVQDGLVWVAFTDSGPGIPPEEQPKVFDPFYRGDQGRRIKQGMGLGLSIARDLAVAHGGRIDLTSAPGQGSTFTLWLPVSTAVD